MKITITINNADSKYREIMDIISELKQIEKIEEIGGCMQTDSIVRSFKVAEENN